MSQQVARFADRHRWMPLLRGTDGLTGRERRYYARRFASTIGSRTRQPRPTRNGEPE